MMVIKVILFITITLTCTLFFYYVRKERVMENAISEAYSALDEVSMKRIRDEKQNVFAQAKGFEKKKKKFVTWPYRLFIYSGVSRMFTGISFEVWTLIMLASAALIYFAAMALLGSLVTACICAFGYLGIILGIEKILSMRNYKIVDDNLIKFLNIFQNFSATDGEIMNILLKVSRFLPNPLSTTLEEAYYDAQTCGDKTAALYAMAEKIEHPRFKEIICDIEICEKYTANYTVTLEQCRKLIVEEQRINKERKELASEYSFYIILITALLLCACVIVNFLVQDSIWRIIFQTTFGHIFLVVVAIIYIFAYYKIAMVER